MSKFTVFTDGGSRGNPGPAGIGGVIFDESGQQLHEFHEYIGEATNNEAEYQAAIKALTWLVQNSPAATSVEFKLDSKLVVEQLSKNWKIKEIRMKKLAEQAWDLLKKIPECNVGFVHVPRSENAEADALVNQALDSYLA